LQAERKDPAEVPAAGWQKTPGTPQVKGMTCGKLSPNTATAL
jgi:hypothetical protein